MLLADSPEPWHVPANEQYWNDVDEGFLDPDLTREPDEQNWIG